MLVTLLCLGPVLVPMLAGALLYAEFRDGAVSKLFGEWE
jgi:hypothetical protein